MKIGSENVLQEYKQLEKYVSKLKPDFKVDDFTNAKNMGDVELLWNIGNTPESFDVISLYKAGRGKHESFAVSYYHSDDLLPGKDVVRRFIGGVVKNWIADTVDAGTGKLLENQGSSTPRLSRSEEKVLKEWNIAE